MSSLIEGLRFASVGEAENYVEGIGCRPEWGETTVCDGCRYLQRKRDQKQGRSSRRMATVMTFTEAGTVTQRLIEAGIPREQIVPRLRSFDTKGKFCAIEVRDGDTTYVAATIYSPQRVRLAGTSPAQNMTLDEYLATLRVEDAVVTVDGDSGHHFVTAADGTRIDAPGNPRSWWSGLELRTTVNQGNRYAFNGKMYRLVQRPYIAPPEFIPTVAER